MVFTIWIDLLFAILLFRRLGANNLLPPLKTLGHTLLVGKCSRSVNIIPILNF